MNALNSILIEGFVKTVETLGINQKGISRFCFTITSQRLYKTGEGEIEEDVSLFDVESYSKLAEACEKNLTIGRGVRVVGRIKQNRWIGEDGSERAKVVVIAEHVEFKPVTKEPVSVKEEAIVTA